MDTYQERRRMRATNKKLPHRAPKAVRDKPGDRKMTLGFYIVVVDAKMRSLGKTETA